MEEKQIDNFLEEAVKKEKEEKIEAEEKEINNRRLFASEIAKELKPMLEKKDYSEIIKAINAIEVNPVISVKSPAIELRERKIEMPEIKIPKAERPVINLKPEIKVKASDVKFPSIININGFRDFAKIIIDVLRGKIRVTASKENPLPVSLVYEKKFYEAMGGGGGGPSKVWLKDTDGTAINPAIKGNQPVPEHKTYALVGNASAGTDDLTPASGKRLRVYGFYGAYTVDAAFNPTVCGSLSFGTGGCSDRTKILGMSGGIAGANTLIFTMTPMNRLGEIDEIIRFTMATFNAGLAEGNFVILYNEE